MINKFYDAVIVGGNGAISFSNFIYSIGNVICHGITYNFVATHIALQSNLQLKINYFSIRMVLSFCPAVILFHFHFHFTLCSLCSVHTMHTTHENGMGLIKFCQNFQLNFLLLLRWVLWMVRPKKKKLTQREKKTRRWKRLKPHQLAILKLWNCCFQVFVNGRLRFYAFSKQKKKTVHDFNSFSRRLSFFSFFLRSISLYAIELYDVTQRRKVEEKKNSEPKKRYFSLFLLLSQVDPIYMCTAWMKALAPPVPACLLAFS